MVNYRSISCCFSLVCFLLFLVSHCSHNWRTYQTLTSFYTMGLWTICSDKTGCKKLHGGHASIEVTRAFLLLALISSFMAVVWAVDWDHLFHCNFTFLPKALIASACNFAAGTSVLIGLVMFEIEDTKVPDRKTSFKDWAFYLTCVAGFLCLFTERHNPEVRIIFKYWFYSRMSGCVGLLFLFVTLVTPNWIRVDSSLSRISLGLWSICIDNNCRVLSEHSSILDACRFLLSISTVCGLVAVSAALISNPRLSQSKWPLITSLTTAFISLLTILLFGLSIMDKISFTEHDTEERDFSYSLSFSFAGGCIGCILFIISGILFILIKVKESAIISPVVRVSSEETDRTPSPEKELDISTDRSDSGIACAYGVM